MGKLIAITRPVDQELRIQGVADLDLVELITLYGVIESELHDRNMRGELTSLTSKDPQEQIIPRRAAN